MINSARLAAVQEASNRKRIEVSRPSPKISEYYAVNVFTTDKMREHLSKDVYKSMMNAIDNGTKIDRSIADQIAAAMKEWATSNGATHHTHWFQPLTGATAEKHDTFFTPLGPAKGLESFSGNQLVQGEPDGSSFPSGGLRDTHEARGYTAWDPSSPAFIMEIGPHAKTLCIPTIFISYTGHSMGYKVPLLKSLNFIENAALPVCNLFDRNIKRVYPTLGWEQEYFLVDSAMYNARPDLLQTGRTLFGHSPAKGQQLDDHYFGSIPERVYAFMLDMETEALKLGIPVSTRHNEVAPGQYEIAPVFSDLNRSVDQNQLMMDVMDRVARRHNLRVLLHEKPFAGLNGSGKHNNWSLATDTGVNLLQPASTPKTNLMFLTFFINTVKAVNENADLLRATIATAGNDHRLGANEAPPAIISVFIGSAMTRVLNTLESKVKKGGLDEYESQDLKLNIHNLIPDLLLDNTDRNRTSPFAYTGNKFEIRAVGSSANCSFPMSIMNTIVAQQLVDFKASVDKLIAKGAKKDDAILRVLRTYVTDSKKILFEGDNYSAAWEKEAKKRGLNNVKTTPEALDFLVEKSAAKIMNSNGILSMEELHARHDVLSENYQLKIQIESRVLGEMVRTQIIPASTKYMNSLITSLEGMKAVGVKGANAMQKNLIKEISERLNRVDDMVEKMIDERRKANKIEDSVKKAKVYNAKVRPYFEKIRYEVDKLEMKVDDSLWPFPKYRELLFIR